MGRGDGTATTRGRALAGRFPATVTATLVAAACLPAGARAAPEAALSVRTRPVPGFPHTGDIAGSGAMLDLAIETRATPSGAPSPALSRLVIGLPPGVKLHPAGFQTCPAALPGVGTGPLQCPPGSVAGRQGSASGLLAGGSQVQQEGAATRLYLAPGGGMVMSLAGSQPGSLDETIPVTTLTTPAGKSLEIGPLQGDSTAPPFLLTHLELFIGSAVRRSGRTTYLVTLPASCASRYLPYTLEASFGTATSRSEYRVPCPRQRTTAPAPAPPSLRLSARALPLAGFAHTGNVAGEGARLALRVGIAGTQYNGYPPPLTGLSLTLPRGMRLSSRGFPRCRPPSNASLSLQPGRCPAAALIGPRSSAQATVAAASGLVSEPASLQSFFDARGNPAFLLEGSSPQPFAIEAAGAFARAGGAERIIYSVPLGADLPGWQDTSIASLALQLGSAVRGARGPRFSLSMPRRCRLGLSIAVTATFAAVEGLPAQTATATYDAPCPRHSHRRSRRAPG